MNDALKFCPDHETAVSAYEDTTYYHNENGFHCFAPNGRAWLAMQEGSKMTYVHGWFDGVAQEGILHPGAFAKLLNVSVSTGDLVATSRNARQSERRS